MPGAERPRGGSRTPRKRRVAAGEPGPSTAAPRGGTADRMRALGTALLLAAVVVLIYGRAIDSPFIFDDLPGIVDNPSIVRLWPPIGDAATRGPLNPPSLAPTARRPLANLTLALNYAAGGLEPAGYHAVNLVLHVLAALVLSALVRRTLLLPYFAGAWDDVAWPLSVVAALLWAVHPLQTEAVNYVTQRTELLAGLCYLTVLWAALRYWTAPAARARWGWLVAAGAASLAGVASKEVVVSAPVIALLYERTFLVPSLREAWRRSWPLYASVALGWALLVILNASGVGGLSDARHQVPLVVWWATQAKVVLLYLKLSLWPWPLSIHYAPAYLRTVVTAWPWVAGVLVLATAVAALAWPRPAVRFVAVAVVAVLAPTLVVPLPKMVAAERRMYLPLAGLVVLAVVGGYRWLVARWPAAGRRIALGLALVLVVAASLTSAARLTAYRSKVTIWRDAVLHQPDDPMAHYNLGVALVDEGRALDEARAHFEQAVRLDPEYAMAFDNLGSVLNRLGRPEEALAQFEQALRLEPADVVALNNLGATLTSLGRAEEAVAPLERALAVDPDSPEVHLNLGKALLRTGRTDAALAHLEQAARLRPGDTDAQYSLGAALLAVGRTEEAARRFEDGLRSRRNDPAVYKNLANVLLQWGQAETAVGYYERALALRPDYADAHNNLATALLRLGRTSEAAEHFEQALRLDPDNPSAHYNLGSLLLDGDRPGDAAAHFQQVARLSPGDASVRFKGAVALARSGQRAPAIAMAEAALALARAQGRTALVGEVDAWLSAYRAGR